MANEIQNHQNVNWGKDHYTDATTDEAIRDLEGSKGDGVSGDEMDKLLKSGADYGQVTEREYSAMRRWVQGNWDRMSPEAQEKWTKFDAAMQQAGGRGTAEKHHGQHEAVIMSGAKLEALMTEISETGRSRAPQNDPCPAPDGVDKPVVDHGNDRPCHHEPSEPSGGVHASGGLKIGDSWEEIFAAIMDKLDQKEKKLKDLAKSFAGRIDQGNKDYDAQQTKYNTDKAAYDTAVKNNNGTPPTDANAPQAPTAPKFSDEVGRNELAQIQGEIQKINTMFTTITNMMQAIHDTRKAAVNNIRV